MAGDDATSASAWWLSPTRRPNKSKSSDSSRAQLASYRAFLITQSRVNDQHNDRYEHRGT